MKNRYIVAFTTLGCKVNYYETEKIMKEFLNLGFGIVKNTEYADIYIINTCSVTNEADKKSRKLMRRPKKINPDAIVAVTGCYAESGKEFLEKDENIDFVFSNSEKDKMVNELILECKKRFDKNRDTAPCAGENNTVEDCKIHDYNMNDDKSDNYLMEDGRVRKYIKIQDGCNQFCTYCLIPYVRGGGRLKSVPGENVVSEVRDIVELGYKEVVLTGIHISSYGVEKGDFNEFVRLKGKPLSELINMIDKVDGIERIRISSLEPRIISDTFMEDLCKAKKIAPHFHLSLQSGSDTVLGRMNRHYTTQEYLEALDIIRKHFDNPAITTDIIVGFPGESDEEFEETLLFVKKAKLAKIHVFPYSAREGTKASKFPEQIPNEIKTARVKRLLEEDAKLQREYEDSFMGKDEYVLWEEEKTINDKEYYLGHNERYIKFAVPTEMAKEMGVGRNCITKLCVEENNLFSRLVN